MNQLFDTDLNTARTEFIRGKEGELQCQSLTVMAFIFFLILVIFVQDGPLRVRVAHPFVSLLLLWQDLGYQLWDDRYRRHISNIHTRARRLLFFLVFIFLFLIVWTNEKHTITSQHIPRALGNTLDMKPC